MNLLKRIVAHPATFILIVFFLLYWDFLIKGLIPFPGDALVGSYLPWLDYKWGYPTGVPVKNPIISDIFSQLFLWKYLALDFFKQGAFPLWNPFSFSGTPLLANYQSAVLFPLNLLLLLPKYLGWGLYISLSTLTAMFTMYLYLSNHVKGRAARLIGSLVFALSGPMTTWVEFGTAVWAASLIPLILWCVDKTISKGGTRFLFGISFFCGLLFLSGHAQISTYLLVLLPLYAWNRVRGTNPPNLLLKICIALSLGIGLAAIQLSPTLDLLERSIRHEENYVSTFDYGLAPLSQFIRLWNADFFGSPTTGNCFIGTIRCHELASFLGTITLPLILPFILRRKPPRPPFNFFSLVFSLSLFLVLDSPISRFIFSLPIPMLTYSSASRLLFLSTLSAAILAAGAVHELTSADFRKKVALSATTLITFTVVSLLFVDKPHQPISLRNSVLPLIFLAALTILSLTKIKTRLLVFFLLILLAFDLTRYFKKYNPFTPSSLIFPNTPITDFLKNQPGIFRIARQYGPILPPNTWTHYRLEAVEGYDPLRLLNYNRLFHLAENKKYFDQASRYSELMDINPKFLGLLNIKYFASSNEPSKPEIKKLTDYGYQPIFKDGRTIIYENPLFKERAFFVRRIKMVTDERSLASELESPDFPPSDEAILVGKNSRSVEYRLISSIPSATQKPNGLTLTLDTPADGFLVISNAYDPGWKATIDGKRTAILPVNGALQGLFVPTGSHKVDLNYLPGSVAIGSIISLLSAGALAIFLKTIKV